MSKYGDSLVRIPPIWTEYLRIQSKLGINSEQKIQFLHNECELYMQVRSSDVLMPS